MPLESFPTLSIEVVKRSIPKSEADDLLKYYSEMKSCEDEQARAWGLLANQVVGAERL